MIPLFCPSDGAVRIRCDAFVTFVHCHCRFVVPSRFILFSPACDDTDIPYTGQPFLRPLTFAHSFTIHSVIPTICYRCGVCSVPLFTVVRCLLLFVRDSPRLHYLTVVAFHSHRSVRWRFRFMRHSVDCCVVVVAVPPALTPFLCGRCKRKTGSAAVTSPDSLLITFVRVFCLFMLTYHLLCCSHRFCILYC